MALVSARFKGDPVLERISNGDTSAYLHFGAQGNHVRAVQFALIDLGYDIPDGATGNFAAQTSDAVVQFKTDKKLKPNDPVVGVGTMTELDGKWAQPFADRDEWWSWQSRPIPEFNFSRQNELDRLRSGGKFTFNPLSDWLPGPFKDALLTAMPEILDPNGSPVGALTPSATWGASPLDFYHCHVVLDIADAKTRSWEPLKEASKAIDTYTSEMRKKADLRGPLGTPQWTAAYRDLVLAPGQPGNLSLTDRLAELLNGLIANSNAEQQTLKLAWGTFETPRWRHPDLRSDNLRRSWWNDVAPVLSGVTQAPFAHPAMGAHVYDFLDNLAFLIDQDRVVTVLGDSLVETAALVNLDLNRIDAAAALPFP